MTEHPWADTYEEAIGKFQRHLHQQYDGTFTLDTRNPEEIGIDPVVFADLFRSMEETNKKIRRSEFDKEQMPKLK
ncbi:MAG TPA: hypothetical protein VE999_22840 [Gemmataceae bacterium]|nr:hypothetical protein [Gemmataceae bacterium]